MVFHRVFSIRRPRRLAVGLTLVAFVLMTVTLRLMISSRRDHRATLFVKSSRDTDRSRHYGDSNVDEDLIPQNRQRQQSVRRNNRQHDESDVVYNLPSANERMERPAPRAKHSPLRNMAPRDEAPGDEEPRDETSRDEESNVEEPRHEIRPAIDLPMREDELLERHIESAEDLRGRHDKIDEISNKSHKKEEPVDEHEDPPLGKRLHPAYADPASSNRKSPVAVNIEDGMEAAVEVADERQNDVIEEDPQLVDVPLPMLTSGHAATGIFDKDIGRVADFRKFVVLTVVDSGYVPIAINFYRTSVATIGLTNFMMVCTDRLAMRMLRLQGIACSLYIVPKVEKPRRRQSGSDKDQDERGLGSKVSSKDDVRGASASDFGTEDYYRKSNAKTSVILTSLELGYNVLIVDADVVMFKDPFPFFNCTACDAHYQMDRDMYNSGFAFIRATPGSLRLYRTAWRLYVKYQKAHDQIYLNMAINRLNPGGVLMGYGRRVSNLDAVRLQSLPVRLFPCGVYYFEHFNRMFENQPPCDECVMVHNNYIGSVSAKVYRFKENMMWTLDDKEYYSNKSTRYFTYDNPRDFGSISVDMEIDALKSAMAISVATGRVLILPTFRCCLRNCRAKSSGLQIQVMTSNNASRVASTSSECSHPRHRCSLLSVLQVNKFDQAFGSRYREHTFLSNRLVPDEIRHGVSPRAIFINTSDATSPLPRGNVTIVTPTNRDRGASLSEVVRWFDERRDETVIRFHSLYGAAIDWSSDKALHFKLSRYFKVGFECSEYEQWDADQLDLAKMWPENRTN